MERVSIKPYNPFGKNMADGSHAFSGAMRQARWGVSRQFERAPVHGADQQLRYTFGEGFTDDEAFIYTIQILQELTARYVSHPEIVQFTRRLLNQARIRNHDELGEVNAIVNYFQGTYTLDTPDHELGRPLLQGDRGSYRYQKDPYGVELFMSPLKVLRDIQAGESGADCDDIAACCACVLAAAGYPSMLMIVDASAGSPGQMNHVLLATKTLAPNIKSGNDWFPVELIHPLNVGTSVKVTRYIPLLVNDYDLLTKDKKLIPNTFR